MSELSEPISALKPEYQQMVLKNQQKYNPDFDDQLNEDEIGVLLTETGAGSVEELLASSTKKYSKRNGPSVHIIVNDTAKFVGSGTSVGVGMGSDGPGVGVGVTSMNGDIIIKKEMTFDTEQEIDDITDEKFKLMFRDLDLDKSGKLSPEEIEKYKLYCQKKTEYINKNERIKGLKTAGGLGTCVISAIIGLLSGSKAIRAITTGIAFLGLVYGIINSFKGVGSDSKQEDEQYKHIGYQFVS